MVRKLPVSFLSPLKGLGFVPISLDISSSSSSSGLGCSGGGGGNSSSSIGGDGDLAGDAVSGAGLGLNLGGDARIGTGDTTRGDEGSGGVTGAEVCGAGEAVVTLVRGEPCRLGMRDGGRIPLGARVWRPEWGVGTRETMGFSGVPESQWLRSTRCVSW